MNPSDTAFWASVGFACLMAITHTIDTSAWGAKLSAASHLRLAAVLGLVSGVVQALAQGLPWKTAVIVTVSQLCGGAAGITGVAAGKQAVAAANAAPTQVSADGPKA